MKAKKNPFLREFGSKIRALRTACNLSQHELADRADITQTYLCEIESGKRNPSVDCVRRILEGLQARSLGAGLALILTTAAKPSPNGIERELKEVIDLLAAAQDARGRLALAAAKAILATPSSAL